VWQQYIQTQLLKAEAEKIGLTVSVAELQDIVAAGQSPMLQQTPFRNEQGRFDKTILDNFLVQYEQNKDNAEIAQQYAPMYEYWKFIEKTLMDNALAEKYQMLITNSFLSHSVAAQSNYEANNATYDIEVAAYPYSAVPEGDVKVSESDIQALYSKNKEQFKQPFESRDIKYVSYQVTPSEADRADLNNEMNEYAEMLKAADADCATIVRQANSEVPFSAVAWKKSSYPEALLQAGDNCF
jgi:peptidyl-prolyl cis-trans isomerase D